MTNQRNSLTWNLSPLAADDRDPVLLDDQEKMRAATADFVAKWEPRQDYLSEPKVLKEALDDYEGWFRDYGNGSRAAAYFFLRSSQDNADPFIKAQNQKATDFSVEMSNAIQFFELRLGKIPHEMQKKFLDEPSLNSYAHFLERIFAASQYQLSEEQEKIISLKYVTSHDKWVELTEQILGQQERTITLASDEKKSQTYEDLLGLITDASKPVRDEAAAALNDILRSVVDVAEAELNAILANKKVDDELRGFGRPDAARHLADDIDSEIVDTLLTAVTRRNNLAQRFYRLKAALLGLPHLAYHERNLQFGAINKHYDFEAGTAVVREVYNKLEPGFGEVLELFLKEGRIDVYPRRGKTGGAFCVNFSKSQPVYLLLNYKDRLQDVTTYGHELGHGVNDMYNMRAQNALNFGTPTSTAEVASQYLEDFIYERLEAEADDESKLAIAMSRLSDDVSAIFRQVACYRFEQSLHDEFRASGYLSKEDIGRLFRQSMESYMGPAVEQSPGSENWWAYWSHIRSFFYVYSYASGLLIAKAMQKATRTDPNFIKKVKIFMEAGSSASPKDVFKQMGIDITTEQFWNDGLDEIERSLENTEKLARRLGKLPSLEN